MIEQIKQIENWDTLTDAEIRSALAEIVRTPTNKLFVLADLRESLTQSEYAAFRLALGAATDPANIPDTFTADPIGKAAAASDVADALAAMTSSGGIQLHQADRQAFIELIATAAGFPPERVQYVMDLPFTVQSRWALLGGSGDVPSVEQLTAARERWQARTAIETQANGFVARANAARSAVAVAYDQGATAAEITAAGEAALAGN